MKRLFLLAITIPLTVTTYSQSVTVSGIVMDSSTNESIIGCGVIHGNRGTVTDNDGRYSISIPQFANDSLLFSYTGYKRKTVYLDSIRDTTIIVMLESGIELNEARVSAIVESGIHSTFTGVLDVPVESIHKAPSLFGEADLLKTIQLMPGVQSGTEGFAGIYVRGGGMDENLFILDGVPLYNVNHLLGFFSAFSPESIKKVTLFKGAFPARFGGRVSSVIDVRTNEGGTNGFHGSFGAGTLCERFHLQGPVFKDRTTVSFSSRFMHTLLYAPVIRMAGSDSNYYFYDLSAKITHRLSSRDKIIVTSYSGNDNLYLHKLESLDKSSIEDSDINWGTTMASIRWNHEYSGKLRSNTMVSSVIYNMKSNYSEIADNQSGSAIYDSEFQSGIKDVIFNYDVDYIKSLVHYYRFGITLTRHNYNPQTRYVLKEASLQKLNIDYSSDADYLGWENALYAEDDIALNDRLSFNVGLRYVLMTTNDNAYHNVEPRLSVKYNTSYGIAFKASYSRMSQYVHLLSASQLSLPSDIWVPITDRIKPVLADHVTLGAYFDGLKGWEFSTEAYIKHSRNILDYRDGISSFGTTTGWDEIVEQGEGLSRGIEFFARKTSGKITGWISYTLSKSEQRFINGYINGGQWYPFKYDRPHLLSVYGNKEISDRLSLSLSWTFMSGACVTLPDRTTVMIRMGEKGFSEDSLSYTGVPAIVNHLSSRNNYRLPASHCLNISFRLIVPKRKGMSEWCFGVYNVYNQMNPNLVYVKNRTEDALSSGQPISIIQMTILPILPSINYCYMF